MILNISGRTDIVAFYTPWFLNRLKEGFVDVRNPFHPKLVSRIFFSDVDAFLFCTKNPLPIIKHIKEIDKPIIFQITLTPYKEDIEPFVPNKKIVIEGIKKIAEILGSEHVYVRYDPVFLSEKYNLEYHKKAFLKVCELLSGSVKHIIISFIDEYKNVRKNETCIKKREFTENDYKEIGISFANSAKKYNMTVQTCFEENNLVSYGFIKAECLSHELAFQLTGKTYKNWVARKLRKCNCVQMVDIGVYNSCKHFCKYCYANFEERKVEANYKKHNPHASLLVGKLEEDDIIKIRKK